MLKVLRMGNVFAKDVDSKDLFNDNPLFTFTIQAPIYWWVDIDWPKYYLNMPLSDFDFCFDAFDEDAARRVAQTLGLNYGTIQNNPRAVMQLLPLSTQVVGTINLSYQEIIEVCENYVAGEYNYQTGYSFPNDREWSDFCETLLDIKGVRDIVKEEI